MGRGPAAVLHRAWYSCRATENSLKLVSVYLCRALKFKEGVWVLGQKVDTHP